MVLMNVRDDSVLYGLRADRFGSVPAVRYRTCRQGFGVDENDALVGNANGGVAAIVRHHVNAGFYLLDGHRCRRGSTLAAAGIATSGALSASLTITSRRGLSTPTLAIAPASATAAALAICGCLLPPWACPAKLAGAPPTARPQPPVEQRIISYAT